MKKPSPSERKASEKVELEVSTGPQERPHRILIYGTGGIGKSTLAGWLPAPLFLDDESGTSLLDVHRMDCPDWHTMKGAIAALQANPPKKYRTIVIDTVTRLQKLCELWILENRGKTPVGSIEEFPWGKGWQFLHEEMVNLLADLDRLVERGFNVCLIAHDVSVSVPNPGGEDWLRWEPDLYSGTKQGRGNVQGFVKGWADHILAVMYDVDTHNGKGQGDGDRFIHTMERPQYIAKTRASEALPSYEFTADDPGAIWIKLGISKPS